MVEKRELNNMRDTPSFKIKKVLALTKLRHSSTSGRKTAAASASTSKGPVKKTTNIKTKTISEAKGTNIVPKGRRGKPKMKEETVSKSLPELKKSVEPNLLENEKAQEKKMLKEKSTEDQPSVLQPKKKLVKKCPKAETSHKPERNLRSQIGEMLMRHGKKVTKAPKPKRKRTLSSDFELLDEKSLKRKLKESAASGTETDQNDSDASSAIDSSINLDDKTSKTLKKKNSLKSSVKEATSLNSSWVDCPSPLVESGKKISKKSKPTSDSRDSSCDGSEASIIVKREGGKQRTIRRQVETKMSGEENSVKPMVTEQDEDMKNKDLQDEMKVRKRGRPPKRKRIPNEDEHGKEIDEPKLETKNDFQPESGSSESTEVPGDNIKKQRVSSNDTSTDPYSFSGVDFEEEEDDREVSFKPSGISGEVKRKPGRPKHGAARQPAVKALKVKSTHKLLISDQKQRPFSRVRGGRILKASQIYRGSGQRKMHQTNRKGLVREIVKKIAKDEKEETPVETTLKEEKIRPVIAPLNIIIADQEGEIESPLSPQHPDLTIIKDLTSPAPSNEDLEPPVLEPADMEPCTVNADVTRTGSLEKEDFFYVTACDIEENTNTEVPTSKNSETANHEMSLGEQIDSKGEDYVDYAKEDKPEELENEEMPEEIQESVSDGITNAKEINELCKNQNNVEVYAPEPVPGTSDTDIAFNICESTVNDELPQPDVKNSNSEINADSDVLVSRITIMSSEESQIDSSTTQFEQEIEADTKTDDCETDSSKLVELTFEDNEQKVIEDCLNYILNKVDSPNDSVIDKTDISVDKEKTEEAFVECDQIDGDVKEKDHRYEMGGIKMKLKRHKGKFKVTRLSEDDESLTPESCPDGVGSDIDRIKFDVQVVMKCILDEIDGIEGEIHCVEKMVVHGTADNENEVFADDAESGSSIVCSDRYGSPADSEKRVPPLTIRLKSGKTGKKPVRKFELRPKLSRSPIEIIAMRQKRYEEEYDKNEATRLAKKLEKQIGKRKNLMKTAFKDANVAETGLTNAEKAGNINELMELCTPCTVPIVDFVKQLNLQPDEEDGLKASPVQESDVKQTKELPQNSDGQKKEFKSGKKSQFKSGRPRGRPPKLKNKLPVSAPGTKLVEQCEQGTGTAENNAVNELNEVGFVGSFVEFLKSKKQEKPKTVKSTGASKIVKKLETLPDQVKGDAHTLTSSEMTPPLATPATTSNVVETVKSKHMSGDKKSGVRYVCNKCEFSTYVEKTMVFHIYSHIPGVSFKCGYCNKDFLSMAGASAHSKNEHHGKESRIVKSKELIESELYHIVEETPKIEATVLKPLESGQGSGGTAPGQVIISLLVDSKLAMKTSKRFVCTHCEYSTDILEDIQQHCKDLHTTENMFACILCADAYFSSEEKVKNHNLSTHPSRPQSYRKLPNFYDIEQMKAAEKTQLEDRGNIFDRMNNLFSSSNIGDETNNEKQRKTHYQNARDFLYVQEGWKNKTSAEADSTTLDNESVGACRETASSPEKEEATSDVAKFEKVCTSDNVTKPGGKTGGSGPCAVSKGQTVDTEPGQGKPSDIVEKSSTEIGTSVQAATGDKKTDSTPLAKESMPDLAVEVSGTPVTVTESGLVKVGEDSEMLAEDKNDDSGVSNLKIVDVVSLRDQNCESGVEQAKKKPTPRATSHSSRGASNLPEVDVDALVLRNERITCTYKCMKCNIHSPYLSAMVEHLKNYHSEITLFTCPYCRGFNSQKPEFTSEVNVHEHVKKVHPSNCAKNEVSLSDTAKTFVQVLAIPSGVECNKVGNTFVIEKDIYMCLKCQAHMPSLDYTFGHLEREHPDAFVQVCPICKTFKNKSDDVVFTHIMKDHKQDPNDHPLSVAIEDNLFVRIPSISKSGAYNDKVTPTKTGKIDTHRKILPKPSALPRGEDSEDDVLVVGETKNLSRPSAIKATGTVPKRGRPALISQGIGSITTAPRVIENPKIRFQAPIISPTHKTLAMQQLEARAVMGIGPFPRTKSSIVKSHSDQELVMDCESIDDPINKITDVVEDDGDAVAVAITTQSTSATGPIIDSSNVISHSAAMAVASSIVSSQKISQTANSQPVVLQSPTLLSTMKKTVVHVPPPPPPLKKFGVPSLVASTSTASQATNMLSGTQSSSAKVLPSKTVTSEKAKLQISRPKSSLFSMTDKLHRLHARAEEREREKERERAAQQARNSPNTARSSPQTSKETSFASRSSPHTKTNSPLLSSNPSSTPINRPVLKVPTYTSNVRLQQRPLTAPGSSAQSIPQSVHNQALAAQRKSLLFPLDLSRTPSPATSAVVSTSQSVVTNASTSSQAKTVSDDLPPDAFKIFNLKPDSRRQKSSPSAPPTVPVSSPATQILGNTIPNIVGTLAAPGTLLQQVQALPYTQLAQMQMAGLSLNPLQLQGLCIPGPNNSFVLANIPQQQGSRPSVSSQQLPQMQIRSTNPSTVTAVPFSQASRLSTAKTVAQALAERSQSVRPLLQPRAKQHIPAQTLLPMNRASAPRMLANQEYYCPYCTQFRPLREYEVKPHIERCHIGKEVLFIKMP